MEAMRLTVETPWGDEELCPDLVVRLFGWMHYQRGHTYTVVGGPGEMTAQCECGESAASGDTSITL